MPFFVVLQERGPAWDESRPLREQDGWTEHAEFMDALADDGFVRLAGPLGDGHPFQAMLIVDAGSEDAIRARLAADPWTPMRMLHPANIEPWDVLLGAVPAASPGTGR